MQSHPQLRNQTHWMLWIIWLVKLIFRNHSSSHQSHISIKHSKLSQNQGHSRLATSENCQKVTHASKRKTKSNSSAKYLFWKEIEWSTPRWHKVHKFKVRTMESLTIKRRSQSHRAKPTWATIETWSKWKSQHHKFQTTEWVAKCLWDTLSYRYTIQHRPHGDYHHHQW